MANSIVSLTGKFDNDTRDKANTGRLLSLAVFNAGNSAQRQTARAQLLGLPDFKILARTDDANAFAVIELLTARGVSFPADSIRTFTVEAYCAGNAADEAGYVKNAFTILGGSTPVVLATTVAGPSALAAAGFTAPPAITVAANAGTVTVSIDGNEAEVINWVINVYIGKLQPMLRGV